MTLVPGPGGGSGEAASVGNELAVDELEKYIVHLDKRTDEYEYWLTQHLRLSGVYWGLTSLHIIGRPHALPREKLITFTMSCWDKKSGGFGAAPDHDPHMLYTCSAVQILAMADALHVLDEPWQGNPSPTDTKRVKIAYFIADLQDKSTGTFHGDTHGEPDTRFIYNAFNALSLLGMLHLVDVPLAVKYIDSCYNLDGGYGTVPLAETHSGQVFVCIASLAIAGVLESRLKQNPQWADRLATWLAERQISSGKAAGALNGRPEKKEDVCYSWWVVSPLVLLQRLHWIDRPALAKFILTCQDTKSGGFSDQPGHDVDVFHTCFSLSGLSLLESSFDKSSSSEINYGLEEIDPIYCMPKKVINKIKHLKV